MKDVLAKKQAGPNSETLPTVEEDGVEEGVEDDGVEENKDSWAKLYIG